MYWNFHIFFQVENKKWDINFQANQTGNQNETFLYTTFTQHKCYFPNSYLINAIQESKVSEVQWNLYWPLCDNELNMMAQIYFMHILVWNLPRPPMNWGGPQHRDAALTDATSTAATTISFSILIQSCNEGEEKHCETWMSV